MVSKISTVNIIKSDYLSFMSDLFRHADENRVTFHPAQDIIKKVITMMEQSRSCICKTERTCPCKESIEELKTDGRCTCMLFCTYKYGEEYLSKYGYLKDGKVTTDNERKEIMKIRSKKD